MKTRVLVALVVVALIVTASIAFAQVQRGPKAGPPAGAPAPGVGCPIGGPGMGLGPAMVRDLNLTPDQVRDLQQLRDNFFAATKTQHDQIQAIARQIAQLWAADPIPVAQIRTLAADMDALRADIRDAGIEHAVQALGVLTPEQREKVRARIGEMGGCCIGMGPGCCVGMGPGMGCGMGMGPGPGMRGRCGMGTGTGTGLGPGRGNATGPRAKAGCCPLTR